MRDASSSRARSARARVADGVLAGAAQIADGLVGEDPIHALGLQLADHGVEIAGGVPIGPRVIGSSLRSAPTYPAAIDALC